MSRKMTCLSIPQHYLIPNSKSQLSLKDQTPAYFLELHRRPLRPQLSYHVVQTFGIKEVLPNTHSRWMQ